MSYRRVLKRLVIINFRKDLFTSWIIFFLVLVSQRCVKSNNVGMALVFNLLRIPPISKALSSKWAPQRDEVFEGTNPFRLVASAQRLRYSWSFGNLQ